MSGAIAGTAILKNLTRSNQLKTVTLTVNNTCNFSCPHCYLQYNQESYLIQEQTINSIFNSDFEHIAIVGKEPLVNSSSIALLEILIEKCYLSNKSISLVTNGMGLGNVKPSIIHYLDYIDVSFDGGVQTYDQHRKGSFQKIIKAIFELQSKFQITFNALHTISSTTINDIEDMVAINRYADFKTIMFSPFLKTLHDGKNEVSIVRLEEILMKFSQSKGFMEARESLILVDIYHLQQDGISFSTLKDLVTFYNLDSKVVLIDKDPLFFGIIRVTYDGYILTPHQSLHPKNYKQAQFLVSNTNLNQVFETMQNNFH